ncbi:DUF4974 domain-containing protein [Olivibacter ginsenosidimutans]|uniref:DUF4974 domain-containing protein n=1 Tax=Olivibacter ginsenosidimutans TaxID=1176537 RepID=A0ABP9AGZ2_9SPHI
MHYSKRQRELARKWLNGTITDAEKKEFSDWYNAQEHHSADIPPHLARSEEEHEQKLLSNIRQRTKKNTPVRMRFMNMTAAACLLLAIGFSCFFLLHSKNNPPVKSLAGKSNTHDLLPGKDQALLILPSGKEIALNPSNKQHFSVNEGIETTLDDDGQVTFTLSDLPESTKGTGKHTVQTPAGGQYKVVLPDGTKVWLNAASSLSFFPNAQQERQVYLKGEAFFEVSRKKPGTPFIVQTEQQEIQVLGTQFNVNAYANEPVEKTTLVSGRVRVNEKSHGNGKELQPGEQAILNSAAQQEMKTIRVNLEEFTAWKDGYFYFHNSDLDGIMRQLARWYNIEIRYKRADIQDKFTGKIPRSVKLSAVLNALRTTGVTTRLEGNVLMVE